MAHYRVMQLSEPHVDDAEAPTDEFHEDVRVLVTSLRTALHPPTSPHSDWPTGTDDEG